MVTTTHAIMKEQEISRHYHNLHHPRPEAAPNEEELSRADSDSAAEEGVLPHSVQQQQQVVVVNRGGKDDVVRRLDLDDNGLDDGDDNDDSYNNKNSSSYSSLLPVWENIYNQLSYYENSEYIHYMERTYAAMLSVSLLQVPQPSQQPQQPFSPVLAGTSVVGVGGSNNVVVAYCHYEDYGCGRSYPGMAITVDADEYVKSSLSFSGTTTKGIRRSRTTPPPTTTRSIISNNKVEEDDEEEEDVVVVLLVTHDLSRTGSPFYCLKMAQALLSENNIETKKKYRMIVVSPHDGDLKQDFLNAGVSDVIILPNGMMELWQWSAILPKPPPQTTTTTTRADTNKTDDAPIHMAPLSPPTPMESLLCYVGMKTKSQPDIILWNTALYSGILFESLPSSPSPFRSIPDDDEDDDSCGGGDDQRRQPLNIWLIQQWLTPPEEFPLSSTTESSPLFELPGLPAGPVPFSTMAYLRRLLVGGLLDAVVFDSQLSRNRWHEYNGLVPFYTMYGYSVYNKEEEEHARSRRSKTISMVNTNSNGTVVVASSSAAASNTPRSTTTIKTRLVLLRDLLRKTSNDTAALDDYTIDSNTNNGLFVMTSVGTIEPRKQEHWGMDALIKLLNDTITTTTTSSSSSSSNATTRAATSTTTTSSSSSRPYTAAATTTIVYLMIGNGIEPYVRQEIHPRMRKLQKLLQQNQQNQRKLNIIVKMVPSQTDVSPFLRLSNLHLSCSREESYPLNTLEAMSLGVPVVATAAGGTEEQFYDIEGTTEPESSSTSAVLDTKWMVTPIDHDIFVDTVVKAISMGLEEQEDVVVASNNNDNHIDKNKNNKLTEYGKQLSKQYYQRHNKHAFKNTLLEVFHDIQQTENDLARKTKMKSAGVDGSRGEEKCKRRKRRRTSSSSSSSSLFCSREQIEEWESYNKLSLMDQQNLWRERMSSWGLSGYRNYRSNCDMDGIFDVEYYLNQYEDLKSAFGGNNPKNAAYKHFIRHGKYEGRKGCQNCCPGVGKPTKK